MIIELSPDYLYHEYNAKRLLSDPLSIHYMSYKPRPSQKVERNHCNKDAAGAGGAPSKFSRPNRLWTLFVTSF